MAVSQANPRASGTERGADLMGVRSEPVGPDPPSAGHSDHLAGGTLAWVLHAEPSRPTGDRPGAPRAGGSTAGLVRSRGMATRHAVQRLRVRCAGTPAALQPPAVPQLEQI